MNYSHLFRRRLEIAFARKGKIMSDRDSGDEQLMAQGKMLQIDCSISLTLLSRLTPSWFLPWALLLLHPAPLLMYTPLRDPEVNLRWDPGENASSPVINPFPEDQTPTWHQYYVVQILIHSLDLLNQSDLVPWNPGDFTGVWYIQM